MILGAYSLVTMVLEIIGVFIFSRHILRLNLKKGEVRFPKGEGTSVIFMNAGTIALITICVLLIAYSTFAIQV